MSKHMFHHEGSPVYQHALAVFRGAAALAQTEIEVLNENLRGHALRVLTHCAAASDPVSQRQQAQSLRYAKLSTLKLLAVAEAVACEQQAPEPALASLRNHARQL